MERLGLFGGTFDPVHQGHLSIALHAAKELYLDRVLFIPAAAPPHKGQALASYGHRVAMLERAVAAHEGLGVSLIETECPAPSYTVETLLALRQRLAGQGQDFYFLMGADSLLEFHLWYRWQELLRLARFVVISRPHIALSVVHKAIEQLPGPFRSDARKMHWQRADGASFILLQNPQEHNIASSVVRKLLCQGQSSAYLDQQVLAYIAQEGLYGFQP